MDGANITGGMELDNKGTKTDFPILHDSNVSYSSS